ncbi:MAG: hypothetical protein JWR50_1818 [Mucilaginibacter sp.]|nr:hypothetical protein [Mucilaginibacter sp.]
MRANINLSLSEVCFSLAQGTVRPSRQQKSFG